MGVPRSRRRFLTDLASCAVVLPPAMESFGRQTHSGIGGSVSEVYWEEVRRQFSFREERVPMNAANLCPSPRVVAERVHALTQDINLDCSSQNRRKFQSLLEASREKVAGALGVTADEVALVRNTSEANNIINNGLPLSAEPYRERRRANDVS